MKFFSWLFGSKEQKIVIRLPIVTINCDASDCMDNEDGKCVLNVLSINRDGRCSDYDSGDEELTEELNKEFNVFVQAGE